MLKEYLTLIVSVVEPLLELGASVESVKGLIFKPVNECMVDEGRRCERLGTFIILDRKG